jgi:UDP-N-acetylmuramoyl-L-alanyl-D-glutamate--2,6-diaminopimelate ligase
MNSSSLLRVLGVSVPNVEILGLSSDSRAVQPGYVFVATHAAKEYIPQAIANGAAMILTEDVDVLEKFDAKCIHVENARLALANLCQKFYPNVPKTLLTVTGTNGKSSTVVFVSQMLSWLKIHSASMGTLGVHIPSRSDEPSSHLLPGSYSSFDPPHLTTYDPISLHKILSQLHSLEVQCVALEATSHGLHQFRLDGLRFDAASLTNVTQDHLDYHGDMEAYTAAKTRLFSDLVKNDGTAVLNKNSPACFFDACRCNGLKVTTYSCDESCRADIVVRNLQVGGASITFDICVFSQNFTNVTYHGIGVFQIENLICALGLILAAYPKIPIGDVVAAIAQTRPASGRMELAAHYNGASIFVDFCHTPDALSRVLTDLSKIPHRSLIVLFGCGGDRDKSKRSQMGTIAANLASRVIVTDDNPRNEDPSKIRQDVLRDVRNFSHIVEIPGRMNAISRAIADINEGDILLVAGRGHESCQIINSDRIPFSDSAYIREVVEGLSLCRT